MPPAEFFYFPFDAGPGSESAENQWGEMFVWMRTTGILTESLTLDPSADDLAVTPGSLTDLVIQVAVGESWVQGFMYQHTTDYAQYDLEENLSGDPRVDLVVVELDVDANVIVEKVITGTPDPSPVAPTPIQNSTIWQMPLAEIYVADGSTTITSMDITDVRVKSVQGDGGSSAVTLSSAGGDETLIADSNAPPNLVTKGLSAGSNISLSSDADSVTISGANAPSDSPICFVYKDSATTGLTNGSTTVIEFDTSILNPTNMWDSMTDPERITIGEDGVYLITVLAGWTGVALSNGSIELQILLNGSVILTRSRMLLVGDEILYLNAEVFYSLTATDYLTLAVINDSGQTLNLESNPQLQAIKIRG